MTVGSTTNPADCDFSVVSDAETISIAAAMKESNVPDTSNVVGGRLRSGDNDRIRYNNKDENDVFEEEEDDDAGVEIVITFSDEGVLVSEEEEEEEEEDDFVDSVTSSVSIDVNLMIPYSIASRLAACRRAANATIKRGDVDTKRRE